LIKKVLIIGSGSVAKRHISNLRRLYPSVLVQCKSASERAIKSCEVDAEIVTAPFNSLNFKSFDLAIIASPASHHLSHAAAFVREKVPVLIEKPLCTQLSELNDFKFDDLNALKVGVGYNLRYMPSAKKVKEILEKGSLGRISTVFAEVGQHLPDWRPGVDYRNGVSAQKKLGGGALLELSHELDYLCWFFGGFQQVSAKLRNSQLLSIDVEDSVDALLTNEANVLFHVHLDFLQRNASRFFRVIGENGTLSWNLIANEVAFIDATGARNVIYSDADYDRNDMYLDQLRAFVDFANDKSEFESNLQSAITVMRLVEAIRISNHSERWVKVEDLK
jgi:predicted dehydrogenase